MVEYEWGAHLLKSQDQVQVAFIFHYIILLSFQNRGIKLLITAHRRRWGSYLSCVSREGGGEILYWPPSRVASGYREKQKARVENEEWVWRLHARLGSCPWAGWVCDTGTAAQNYPLTPSTLACQQHRLIRGPNTTRFHTAKKLSHAQLKHHTSRTHGWLCSRW